MPGTTSQTRKQPDRSCHGGERRFRRNLSKQADEVLAKSRSLSSRWSTSSANLMNLVENTGISRVLVARPISINLTESADLSQCTHETLLVGLHRCRQCAIDVENDQTHGKWQLTSRTDPRQ